ncbi:hypothetical protein DVH05_027008 [Phytophthora capsici]|nr:hypothetical protein DVH05_027008 [Phytophthora capsici]
MCSSRLRGGGSREVFEVAARTSSKSLTGDVKNDADGAPPSAWDNCPNERSLPDTGTPDEVVGRVVGDLGCRRPVDFRPVSVLLLVALGDVSRVRLLDGPGERSRLVGNPGVELLDG